MYWKLYFSPFGKSSLAGTCQVTISYRLLSGFSFSSLYTTFAGISIRCCVSTPTQCGILPIVARYAPKSIANKPQLAILKLAYRDYYSIHYSKSYMNTYRRSYRPLVACFPTASRTASNSSGAASWKPRRNAKRRISLRSASPTSTSRRCWSA